MLTTKIDGFTDLVRNVGHELRVRDDKLEELEKLFLQRQEESQRAAAE